MTSINTQINDVIATAGHRTPVTDDIAIEKTKEYKLTHAQVKKVIIELLHIPYSVNTLYYYIIGLKLPINNELIKFLSDNNPSDPADPTNKHGLNGQIITILKWEYGI